MTKIKPRAKTEKLAETKTEKGQLLHSNLTVQEIKDAANSPTKKFSQAASDFTLAQEAEKDQPVKPNRGSEAIEPGIIGPHEKSQAY